MPKSSGSEVVVAPRTTDLTQTMTVVEVQRDVGLIQKIITQVMKEGTHYGTIPGTGRRVKNDKGEWVERGNPTLYKAGAEKLASVFRLAVDPEIEDLSTEDSARFRVRCRITTQATGTLLGVGVGEASTEEEKWKWRKASSQHEYDEASPERRRNKVKDFYDRDTGQKKTTETLQVRTNPADLANTALKMAKKRALIDGILTVTAASDIFAQDLEDLPEGIIESLNEAEHAAQAEPVRMATPKAKGPSGPSDDGVVAQVGNSFNTKPGTEGPANMTQEDDKPEQDPLITDGQRIGLEQVIRAKKLTKGAVKTFLKSRFNVDEAKELRASQLEAATKWVGDQVGQGVQA